MGFLDFCFITNPFSYLFDFIPTSNRPIQADFFMTTFEEDFYTSSGQRFLTRLS